MAHVLHLVQGFQGRLVRAERDSGGRRSLDDAWQGTLVQAPYALFAKMMDKHAGSDRPMSCGTRAP